MFNLFTVLSLSISFRGKWTLEVEFVQGEKQEGFIKVNNILINSYLDL